MATTDNNPKRYPSPRKLTRSMRRFQGLPSRIPLESKPAPLAEKIQVSQVKAAPLATFKAKLARGFRAMTKIFKAQRG